MEKEVEEKYKKEFETWWDLDLDIMEQDKKEAEIGWMAGRKACQEEIDQLIKEGHEDIKQSNIQIETLTSDLQKAEKAESILDLMRDEFARISVCPGVNSEIKALCTRAQSNITYHVPLIKRVEKAESELSRIRLGIGDDYGDDPVYLFKDLKGKVRKLKEGLLKAIHLLDLYATNHESIEELRKLIEGK